MTSSITTVMGKPMKSSTVSASPWMSAAMALIMTAMGTAMRESLIVAVDAVRCQKSAVTSLMTTATERLMRDFVIAVVNVVRRRLNAATATTTTATARSMKRPERLWSLWSLPEQCDLSDNDCDGEIDEGFDRPCTPNCVPEKSNAMVEMTTVMGSSMARRALLF